jgi:hypothetical protein
MRPIYTPRRAFASLPTQTSPLRAGARTVPAVVPMQQCYARIHCRELPGATQTSYGYICLHGDMFDARSLSNEFPVLRRSWIFDCHLEYLVSKFDELFVASKLQENPPKIVDKFRYDSEHALYRVLPEDMGMYLQLKDFFDSYKEKRYFG